MIENTGHVVEVVIPAGLTDTPRIGLVLQDVGRVWPAQFVRGRAAQLSRPTRPLTTSTRQISPPTPYSTARLWLRIHARHAA